jgi:transcription factor IIIB subunit 2
LARLTRLWFCITFRVQKVEARTSGPGRRQTSQEPRRETLNATNGRTTAKAFVLKQEERHGWGCSTPLQPYYRKRLRTSEWIRCDGVERTTILSDYPEPPQVTKEIRSRHVSWSAPSYWKAFRENCTDTTLPFALLFIGGCLDITLLHFTKQLDLVLLLVGSSPHLSFLYYCWTLGEGIQRVTKDVPRLALRMDINRTGPLQTGIYGAMSFFDRWTNASSPTLAKRLPRLS